MKPDLIFANSPYGKPGVEITKYIMENFSDANYAMLNTRSAFKKYYDKLACAFVQIGKYELGSNNKLDWGVEQAILLATNGWTQVVDNRKKGNNMVGVNHIWLDHTGSVAPTKNTHLVGVPACLDRAAWNHRERNATLVQVNKSGPYLGGAPTRSTHLVGVSIQTTSTASVINKDSFLTETDKDVPPSTCNGKRDYNLRSGYLYVSFETFEEACECAIDIVSWKNPTDSHHRCVRWGFVVGLVSHERYKAEK